MKKKPKTLGRFLTKKYITTSILLLGLISIFTFFIQIFLIGNNSDAKALSANKIVRSDYQNINISALEDVGGWLEILDENNNVIYTKGNVQKAKTHYTQNQLLEMDGLQAVIDKKNYQFGPMFLEMNNPKQSYMATFAPFKGEDRKNYTCIAKIPKNGLRGNINPVYHNLTSMVTSSNFKWLPVILLPLLLIFIFCLRRYSKSVKEHIVAPNTILIDGLRTINEGDYSKKIHVNAEYEYVEIENSFNHLADQLKKADQQRTSYEKERQLLFANMAHDLRTPLTTIQGTAKAVADGLVSDDKLTQTMETIMSKTAHMNELVNRLLIFSKLESPDYQLHCQNLDLVELIREVLLEQLDVAEKNKIHLNFDLPESALEISGDPTELRRVFDNLIGNSIQHNPPETTVQLKLYTLDNQLVFEIKDDGTPIPKELQTQLFDPFVSGDSSRSTQNGSGLGLAISKKIVEKHGGNILFVEVNKQEKLFQIFL